jgi:hypothetical protein
MNTIARFLILMVFALLACSSAIAQGKKPLDALYDKQKNETTFFLSPMLAVKMDALGTSGINLGDGVGVRPVAGEAMKMACYIKFAGKSYSTPTKVTIAFESYHYRTFQYTVDRDLTIKTPNQKYSFGKMDLTGRRSETLAFYETLELAVPVEQYREIVQAGKMEISLGPTTFALTTDQVTSLQLIANKYLK